MGASSAHSLPPVSAIFFVTAPKLSHEVEESLQDFQVALPGAPLASCSFSGHHLEAPQMSNQILSPCTQNPRRSSQHPGMHARCTAHAVPSALLLHRARTCTYSIGVFSLCTFPACGVRASRRFAWVMKGRYLEEPCQVRHVSLL